MKFIPKEYVKNLVHKVIVMYLVYAQISISIMQAAYAVSLPSMPTTPSVVFNQSSSKSGTIDGNTGGDISYLNARVLAKPGAVIGQVSVTIESLVEGNLSVPQIALGMTNVTAGESSRVFRFLPDGQLFSQPVEISLPYEPNKLPAGTTPDDIKTFYYDVKQKQWIALERIKIDKEKNLVISKTTHFTDMINSTITKPEHPTSQLFNPNRLQNIAPPSAVAGITMISPPEPNSSGTASLNYPIVIPSGRKGMQPQLVATYNSGNTNGWLGLGWDLALPAITIDTRWGVPRYLLDSETESYLINGSSLLPLNTNGTIANLPHRPNNESIRNFEARISQRAFKLRKEGVFSRIVRHGTSPQNYWWEVTDRQGIRYFYGGTPELKVDSVSNLSDEEINTNTKGAISRWLLRQTRDLQDNVVNYYYTKQSATAPYQGVQIYPDSIEYTANVRTGIKPAYKIKFFRQSKLPGFSAGTSQNCGNLNTRRCDVQLDARDGFQVATDDLLAKIEISYVANNANLLSKQYIFQYESANAYRKTILKSIIQLGADGSELARNIFDYYPDNQQPNGFGFVNNDNSGNEVNVGDDPVKKNLYGIYTVDSALSMSRGQSRSGHLYLGLGPCKANPNTPPGAGTPSNTIPSADENKKESEKSASGGMKVGIDSGKTTSVSLLIDINGDGKPDKVYQTSSGFFWRENRISTNGTLGYSDPRPISGLSNLGRDKSDTFTFGPEVHGAAGNNSLSFMANYARTISVTQDYFSDVNSDGLVDWIQNGSVFFNRLDSSGNPSFKVGSNQTIYPLLGGNTASSLITSTNTNLIPDNAEVNAQFTPVDSVVRWQAPYNGVVQLSLKAKFNAVATKNSNSTYNWRADVLPYIEDGGKPDGIIIQVEDKNGLVLTDSLGKPYFRNVQPEENTNIIFPSGVPARNIAVKEGDVFYFRVHSKYDGAYDQLNFFLPEVRYVNSSNGSPLAFGFDVDNNFFHYKFFRDLEGVSANTFLQVPDKGTDFTTASSDPDSSAIVMPLSGIVRVDGNFVKLKEISDSFRIIVTINGVDSTSSMLKSIDTKPSNNATYRTATNEADYQYFDLKVNEGDRIGIKLHSESHINLGHIKWSPRLFYLVRDDRGPVMLEDKPLIVMPVRYAATVYKPVAISDFNSPSTQATYRRLKSSASFSPQVKVFYKYKTDNTKDGSQFKLGDYIVLSVKKDGKLISQAKMAIDQAGNASLPPTITMAGLIDAYLEVSFPQSDIEPRILGYYIALSTSNGTTATTIDWAFAYQGVSSYTTYNVVDKKSFGGNAAYRGWTAFGYRTGYVGNGTSYLSAIDPKRIDESSIDGAAADACRNQDANACRKLNAAMGLSRFVPDYSKDWWAGAKSLGAVNVDPRDTDEAPIASRSKMVIGALETWSAREGIDNPDTQVRPPPAVVGDAAARPVKLTRSEQRTLGGGFSIGSDGGLLGGGLSLNGGSNNSKGLLDVMDLNGDRFPDIVAGNSVQYTLPSGRLSDVVINTNIDSYLYTKGNKLVTGISPAIKAKISDNNHMLNLGIQGSLGGSSSAPSDMMIDINGDGLPDKIRASQVNNVPTLLVALNLGYKFSPTYIPWGTATLGDNSGTDTGLSRSLSFNAGEDYALAFGLSGSLSQNTQNASLIDMNGDGLPDYVVKSDPMYLAVSFNTGSGFAPPVNWKSNNALISASEGAQVGSGLYVTISHCILPPLKIIINPGFDISATAQRQQYGLDDLDGDGFIDEVSSNSINNLTVRRNTTGPALLLRRVNNPLGGSFEIEYQRTQPSFMDPNAKWTFSGLRVFDNTPGDGADVTYTTYRYENGFYNRFEREFYGFSKVIIEVRDTLSQLNPATVRVGAIKTIHFNKANLQWTNLSGYLDWLVYSDMQS